MRLQWIAAICKRLYGHTGRYVPALLAAGLLSSTARAQQITPAQPVSLNTQIQEMEARIRELEAQQQEHHAKYASLVNELDDKAAAKDTKKDVKPYVIGSDPKMSPSWKNGVEMESANKDFRGKFRGRTQLDSTGFTAGSQPYYTGTSGDMGQNAVDFRRLRLGAEGTFYEQYDWALEFDIVNSVRVDPTTPGGIVKNYPSNLATIVPAPTDVWINMKDIPLIGNARAGNIKYPIGLEHATSSRFLDFMERSLNQDAFTGVFNNGFAPGAMIYDWNEDQTATYALSYYKNSQNVYGFDAGSGNNAFASRLTWTPWYDEPSHGRYMMHLGFSSQYTGMTDDQFRIRARGSLRNGISQYWPTLADTGTFNAINQVLLIPEWSMVWGQWHFQAEYAGSFVNGAAPTTAAPGAPTSQLYVSGYYVQAMYFLTGEHREYERKAGAFGRVVPHENFHFIRRNGRGNGFLLTRGAWQAGYRFNQLDLRSGFINGGVMDDHTLGLNHFINPSMKVQYNFVVSNRNLPVTGAAASGIPGASINAPATSYGFGIRLAHDF